MEKYSDWRDKGTGIAPFLPPTIKKSNIFECIFYSGILIMKSLLSAPFIILYLLTKSNSILIVILKLLFGWKSDISVQGVKRSEVAQSKHYPSPNAVYFCNMVSILDGIMLKLIAQSNDVIFVIPAESSIFRFTLIQLMKFIANGSLNVKEFGKEIENFNEYNNHVIYFLAEGTCSNGKSVLPFALKETFFTDLMTVNKLPIKYIQLKLNSSLVTPLGIVSTYQYILRCLSKGVNYKCKINDTPINPNMDLIRTSLCDGGKYKLVSKKLDLNAKQAFIKEYNSYRRK